MSTATDTTKSVQKKPKKDYKQELLEQIQQKYGTTSAAVMDKALKTQDKQIEQAMIEGGRTAEQIGQTKGIDFGSLDKPSKNTDLLGQLMQNQGQVKAEGISQQPQQNMSGARKPAGSMLSLGSETEQPGSIWKVLQFLAKGQLQEAPTQRGGYESPSLIRQREANTRLMEAQSARDESGETAKTVYRNPVTGELVDPEQAEKDMEEGVGVYQMNQVLSTRSGVREVNMNKIPDLTQEEKKYVNDAEKITKTLVNIKSRFKDLYSKYGKSNWQTFQMEKVPYIFAQNQDVQTLKSDLNYLKADIPFLRGGKALTKEEGKRVDTLLNPFGKSQKTYEDDINRFEEEFITGKNIMKFGVNADLMKKFVKSGINKAEKEQPQTTQSNYVRFGKNKQGQRVGQLADGTIEVIK